MILAASPSPPEASQKKNREGFASSGATKSMAGNGTEGGKAKDDVELAVMETQPSTTAKLSLEEIDLDQTPAPKAAADVDAGATRGRNAATPEAQEQGEDEYAAQFKVLKRQSGWKTCLIVFLCIVCAILFASLLVAMLNVAKLERFSSFECGTPPTFLPFVPSKPAVVSSVEKVLSACNNNGYLFDGETACECFSCFSGPTCERYEGDSCTIDVNSGSPEVFVEYWAQHSLTSTIKMSHRIGYGPRPVWDRLEKAVRAVHKLVNNVDAEGKFLVFADGATPLISVAQMVARDRALEGQGTCQAAGNDSDVQSCVLPKTKVWAQKPFYSGYNPVSFPAVLEFAAENTTAELAGEADVLEFVTTPNNPDGDLRTKEMPTRTAIWDMAYYWPMYTAMEGPQKGMGADDISLWTMSKLTGHASARIGWAFVNDEGTRNKMQAMACPIGCPLQSQMFAITALEHVVETKGQLLTWGRQQFQRRWVRLKELFASTRSFEIANKVETRTDSWSGATGNAYEATTPYLWFNITQNHPILNGRSLTDLLKENGIAGRNGEFFGASDEHMRISLFCASSTFDIFIRRMKTLFDKADALLG